MTDSGAIKVTDRLDDPRRDKLRALFQSAWWTAARTQEAIERMLEASELVDFYRR